MRTKVLVTGASGQLAKSIEHFCLNHCDSIDFVFASKDQLDITRKEQIQEYFEKHNFKYCINCAAYTNVEQAEVNPNLAMKVNFEATKLLAHQCKLSNTILIHISTDYVFDGTKALPYKEDDLVNPINQYGLSKYKGERAIQDILTTYFIIRTSWLYSKYGKNFVTTIAKRVQNQDNLSILNTQLGSPTSCHELAKFIIFLVESETDAFGIYNYTDEGQANWYEFATIIALQFEDYDMAKLESVAEYKTKAERPKYSVLSNSKRNKIYPFNSQWKANVKWVVDQIKQH